MTVIENPTTRRPAVPMTEGGVPACGCGNMIGWTRYIRGHLRCEVCALVGAQGKAGVLGG